MKTASPVCNAFTLTELLGALGIGALLTVIRLPVMASVRRRVRRH